MSSSKLIVGSPELLKCGFCKKLLLYECNSDQLPTFFILSSLLGGCNSKATANPPKSDDRMKKNLATGQSCIRKEVTSYKIHTLTLDIFCQFKWTFQNNRENIEVSIIK